MLYDQIRYADEVRTFYRLRNRPVRTVNSGIVQSLGYSKYSNYFYMVKRRLKEDEVIDKDGKFVENPPNAWLARLPEEVDDKARETLGYKTPYIVFLAAMLQSHLQLGELSNGLDLSRRSVYSAASRLVGADLLQKDGTRISVAESPVKNWLSKYLATCLNHADISGDISILFRTVPAYIDGPRSYYAIHRVSGMPIGRADMVIVAPKLLVGFWEGAVRSIRYFREYQKKVEVSATVRNAEVVWVDKLPFNAKAKAPR